MSQNDIGGTEMLNTEYKNSSLKIFSLEGNQPLAQEVANLVGIPLGKSTVKRFADGEVKLILKKVSVVVMCLLFNQHQTR